MAPTDRYPQNESVRIGRETAYGSPAAAKYLLNNLKLDFDSDATVETDKPNGSSVATVATTTSLMTRGKYNGKASFTELPLVLCGNLGYITPTNVGVGAKQWDWNPLASGNNPPCSYSAERGNEANYGGYSTGVLFPSLNIEWTRNNSGGSVQISGDAMGQAFFDDKVRYIYLTGGPTAGTFTLTIGGQTTTAIPYNVSASVLQAAINALSGVGANGVSITGANLPAGPLRMQWRKSSAIPTITSASSLTGGTSPAVNVTRLAPSPTELPLKNVQPISINYYAATTAAGLDTAETGGNKLLRCFQAKFANQNRFGPVIAGNSDFLGPSDYAETEPSYTGGFLVDADAVGLGFYQQQLDNTPVFFRVACTGPLIPGETTQTYYWRTDMCLLLNKRNEQGVTSNVISYQYDGEMARDATWAKFMSMRLITDTAALA